MRGSIQIRVGSNVANVGNFDDNGLNVNNWNAANVNDNLWAAPLVVSSAEGIESILQAFFLPFGGCFGVLSNGYLLLPDYLWQALRELLISRVLHLVLLKWPVCFPIVELKREVQKYSELRCPVSVQDCIALSLETKL